MFANIDFIILIIFNFYHPTLNFELLINPDEKITFLIQINRKKNDSREC